MNYTPHTGADITHMLNAIGARDVEALFDPVPESLRLRDGLSLPEGLSEMETVSRIRSLAGEASRNAPDLSFVGAGAYDHFMPAVIDTIISRSEFYTAYTPYQPEVSQGTLRAIFEFQSMVCELTGLDIANASMYDGASALAEAVLMSVRVNGGSRVLLPGSLNPNYRAVVETYTRGIQLELIDIPWAEEGTIDLNSLEAQLDDETAAVVVQNPNFFGVLEPLDRIGALLEDRKTCFVGAVNPISLGIIRPPGDFGADIVVGDGQPLGIPLAYGGPYVGFLACRDTHVRRMPGRICGQTTDVDGKRGFVLTLQTREQHIRRDRATSNICTNQTLCATAATVYLSAVGPEGLREVGTLNWNRSHEALDRLSELPGNRLRFKGATFNEFVIETEGKASEVLTGLRKRGIHGGVDLGRYWPELDGCVLVCVTETKTAKDIDHLVSCWGDL